MKLLWGRQFDLKPTGRHSAMFTLILAAGQSAQGRSVPYVDATAGDAGTGANWADAFVDLHDALSAAGDTFTTVMTDSAGRFDLVIDGTLLSQSLAPGDLDGDNDVDGNDFLTFSNCFNGAVNPPACL